MSITNTATSLLSKFGEVVTLVYETDEVRNPATGEITTPATENEVPGVGYPSRFTNAEVDGTVVRRSDTRLILNKVTQEPAQGWRAQVQGKTFRVMDVQPITRSGLDVIYICQLRV
jgi:hypothetical protein